MNAVVESMLEKYRCETRVDYENALKTFSGLWEEKFSQLDFELAKNDVHPFVKDPAALALCSTELFLPLLSRLKVT